MRYISILRGINVSGQKQIKMAALKSLYEKLGFSNVVTYIQSGNVIFDTDIASIESIQKKIQEAIVTEYGFSVPVVLRSHQALKRLIEACPFGRVDVDTDGTRVLVTFLSAPPTEEKAAGLLGRVQAPEALQIKDSEVYLYCPNGYGKSKLSNNFIESQLGLTATTRNWKSVLALYELSRPGKS